MAVWRISSLLVNENGPWNIFVRVREWAGIGHDYNGRAVTFPDRFFAQMLSCVWCTSVWVSIFMTLFVFTSPYWAFRFAVFLAFSTGAIMINKYVTGG